MNPIYNINDEPIVLSKAVMDKFLNSGHYTQVLGLYSFYYYTAKWQKTNQVYATREYISKKIGISIRSISTYKKMLEDMGLIENIVQRDNKNAITGHYVKINFIWGEQAVSKIIFQPQKSQCAKNDPVEVQSQCAKNAPMQNLHTYALSINNTYALNSNKQESKEETNGTVSENQNQENPLLACLLDKNNSIEDFKDTKAENNEYSETVETITVIPNTAIPESVVEKSKFITPPPETITPELQNEYDLLIAEMMIFGYNWNPKTLEKKIQARCEELKIKFNRTQIINSILYCWTTLQRKQCESDAWYKNGKWLSNFITFCPSNYAQYLNKEKLETQKQKELDAKRKAREAFERKFLNDEI